MLTVLGSAAGADGNAAPSSLLLRTSPAAPQPGCSRQRTLQTSLLTFPFFEVFFYASLLHEQINIPGRDRGEQRSRSGGSCRSSPHASGPLWPPPPAPTPSSLTTKKAIMQTAPLQEAAQPGHPGVEERSGDGRRLQAGNRCLRSPRWHG